AGGSIVIQRQFDPSAWFAAVERERCTMAHLAPVMVKTLAEHTDLKRYDLSSLRRIHYGSAPVPPEELKRAIAAFGPILAQLYGMTEHLLSSCLAPEDQQPDGDARDIVRLASAGKAYPGTSIRIVDDAGVPLPTGAIGEVVVHSEGMMSGYWNQPVLTAETIRDGWLHSGDMGTLDADGFLTIVDRKKDMIISGGENIYSLEVENALLAHPAVGEVAVIGVPDPKWGESVKAFVVLREGMIVTELDLIEHCRTQIASYKRPRSVEMLRELPRLATRKVDKKALRAPYWAGRERGVA
ncbi:MAG: AMP-binding protein, partial [Burkholderiales bacterium]